MLRWLSKNFTPKSVISFVLEEVTIAIVLLTRWTSVEFKKLSVNDSLSRLHFDWAKMQTKFFSDKESFSFSSQRVTLRPEASLIRAANLSDESQGLGRRRWMFTVCVWHELLFLFCSYSSFFFDGANIMETSTTARRYLTHQRKTGRLFFFVRSIKSTEKDTSIAKLTIKGSHDYCQKKKLFRTDFRWTVSYSNTK